RRRDSRSRREGRREMLGIDRVDRHKVGNVGEEDADPDDILERFASGFEQGSKIAEDLSCLGFDSARDDLARRRVLADLAAEENEMAGPDRGREWAGGSRELVGTNGFDGHAPDPLLSPMVRMMFPLTARRSSAS